MSSFWKTYRIDEEGARIDGVVAMAFIHNVEYHLTHISIYADGMIDCWSLVNFEDFKKEVRRGWVVLQPPEGAEVSVSLLARFKAIDANYWIEPEEFIREVADEIEDLNGRPTTSDLCLKAWKAFQVNPSQETKEALRRAYLAIPKHNRRYVLGDMDQKDFPIRQALDMDAVF